MANPIYCFFFGARDATGGNPGIGTKAPVAGEYYFSLPGAGSFGSGSFQFNSSASVWQTAADSTFGSGNTNITALTNGYHLEWLITPTLDPTDFTFVSNGTGTGYLKQAANTVTTVVTQVGLAPDTTSISVATTQQGYPIGNEIWIIDSGGGTGSCTFTWYGPGLGTGYTASFNFVTGADDSADLQSYCNTQTYGLDITSTPRTNVTYLGGSRMQVEFVQDLAQTPIAIPTIVTDSTTGGTGVVVTEVRPGSATPQHQQDTITFTFITAPNSGTFQFNSSGASLNYNDSASSIASIYSGLVGFTTVSGSGSIASGSIVLTYADYNSYSPQTINTDTLAFTGEGTILQITLTDGATAGELMLDDGLGSSVGPWAVGDTPTSIATTLGTGLGSPPTGFTVSGSGTVIDPWLFTTIEYHDYSNFFGRENTSGANLTKNLATMEVDQTSFPADMDITSECATDFPLRTNIAMHIGVKMGCIDGGIPTGEQMDIGVECDVDSPCHGPYIPQHIGCKVGVNSPLTTRIPMGIGVKIGCIDGGIPVTEPMDIGVECDVDSPCHGPYVPTYLGCKAGIHSPLTTRIPMSVTCKAGSAFTPALNIVEPMDITAKCATKDPPMENERPGAGSAGVKMGLSFGVKYKAKITPAIGVKCATSDPVKYKAKTGAMGIGAKCAPNSPAKLKAKTGAMIIGVKCATSDPFHFTAKSAMHIGVAVATKDPPEEIERLGATHIGVKMGVNSPNVLHGSGINMNIGAKAGNGFPVRPRQAMSIGVRCATKDPPMEHEGPIAMGIGVKMGGNPLPKKRIITIPQAKFTTDEKGFLVYVYLRGAGTDVWFTDEHGNPLPFGMRDADEFVVRINPKKNHDTKIKILSEV